MTDRDAPAVASAAAGASSPLTLVSQAVAGHDLSRIAASAHEVIGRPVAITIPALGEPVAWPAGSVCESELGEAVTVRIGDEVVGTVAVAGPGGSDEERAWLEAAAEAAAVAVLMRETRRGGPEGSRRALLQALRAGPVADVSAVVNRAGRLGFDLSAGAVGIFAVGEMLAELPTDPSVLIAGVGGDKVCALVPLATDEGAEQLAAELADRGLTVAVSGPRRDPAMLHEALREAELLAELTADNHRVLDGLQDTYRLLIGVMLRDPQELERLRAQTISPLVIYDFEHETELVATLEAFLAHDGSTTDTAEAMRLHRHTVGYRLSRVQEVSGLSPYESDGRERLSLGLKAHHILNVAERL